MSGFISKQPNGKYCRFSTIVDCPTHINMTEEDYVKVIMSRGYAEDRAREEKDEILENYLQPYSEVLTRYINNNMSKEEFEEVKRKMEDPNGEFEIL